MPRPTVGRGCRLAHRIGMTPRMRSADLAILLLLAPLLLGLVGMLLAAGLVVALVGLALPRGRRRLRGELANLRHRVRVEMDRFPVLPGDEVELLVMQRGGPRLEAMTVHVACTEVARYRQGTDTESVDEVIARHAVELDPAPEPGTPAAPEIRGRVRVPEDAMHSFASDHNDVRWTVEIERTFPGTAPVTSSLEFVVAPLSLGVAAACTAGDGIAGAVGPVPLTGAAS